jgi:hypothetical protein
LSITRPLQPWISDRTLPQLEVGILEHLLDAQAVLGDLTNKLLALTGEVAQLLDGGWHVNGG